MQPRLSTGIRLTALAVLMGGTVGITHVSIAQMGPPVPNQRDPIVTLPALEEPPAAAVPVMPMKPAETSAPETAASPANPPESAKAASSSLTIGANTQKVPEGTFLTIAFSTPMDSRTVNPGDPFHGILTEDFAVSGSDGHMRVILPAGTVVRGRMDTVQRPSFFSKGGAIFLAFDHVMLPSGELVPLSLNLSTENTIVNKNGALYTDPGIGPKVKEGFEDGKEAFNGTVDRGYEVGKQVAGGFGSIITVPAAVIGGTVAGTAITTGKAVKAVFGKGESVVIKPGDTVTIDFGGSFNLPAE